MRWLTRSKTFSDPADILAYLWENYEKGTGEMIEGDRIIIEGDRISHFVLSRATKMIYLVDWRYASKHGRQATDVQWYFDRFGPYVNLVSRFTTRFDLGERNPDNKSPQRLKRLLFLKDEASKDIENTLPLRVQEICDGVIKDVRTLDFLSFIRYVYNTPPVQYSARYTTINIVKIAKYFKHNT